MPRTLSDIYGELYDELRAMVEKRTVELIKQDCDRCYIRTDEYDIDEDDIIFYEVAMEKREDNAYLVTGNMKHYPVRDFIVTPAEMVAILEEKKAQEGKEKE